MPNYRNKNKNKRNKNRNKNSNQNKNSQEQQQQQQNEEQPKSKKTAAKVHDKELLQRQQPAEAVVDEQQHVGCIPNMPVRTQSSDDDDLIAARSTPPTADTHRIICNAPEQLPASEEVSCTEQVAPETTTGNAMPIGDADTVSRDTSTNIERLPAGSSSIITKTTVPLAEDFLMGATNSKQQIEARNQSSIITTGLHDEGAEMRTISITRQQGKVIVHRVIQEGTASTSEEEISSISSQPDESDPKLIIHAQQEASPDTAVSTANATFTIHQEDPECTEVTEQVATQEAKIIVHKVSQQEYRVDSPQPKVTEKQAPKLRKTRSLDDDEEESQLQIQEISDNSSGGETDNPPLISEAESESEEDRTIVLDTNDNGEPSRSAAPNQDNYKQRRAQKRAAIENHFLPQFLIPRYLDSILEENSDMSDARSEKSNIALSRSTSGNFEDEQHDDEHETKAKKANAVFPRSNLDFTKKHKHGTVPKAPTQQAIIREETVPMMVEAKIIEQPIIVERCSTWSSAQTPESEAAEVVYINSASSSVSDLLDLDYEDALAGSSRSSVDLDTDVNEIFSKPSKAYIELTHIDPMIDDQRERTPVNETSSLAAIVAEPTHSISKSTTTTNTFTQITNERTLKQCKTSGQSSSEQLLAANKNTSSTHSALASHDCNTSKAENSEISKNYILAKAADTSATTSPTSCVSIANDNVQYSEILRNFQMNDIREILNDVANKSSVNTSASVNRSSVAPIVPHRVAPPPPDKGFYCLHDDPPPPIPPPPQTYNQPQVVDTVASPDFHLGEPISAHNCNNNTDSIHTSHQQQQQPTLPQPNTSSLLARQESGDSHGSDSTTHSQCTAINIDSLTHSDWADFDAESSVSGGISAPTTDGSVAEDQSVNLESSEAGSTICLDDYKDKDKDSDSAIKKLRLLCTQTLASMPYGEDILEELASVAQNIGEARATKTITKAAEMPYPLPNLPHITDIQVSMSSSSSSKPTNVTLTQVPPTTTKEKLASPPPPPVPEPPSKYESWLGVPTESDPKLLVCLSPSQRSFMADDKASAGNKPDHLLDAHKKFVERRGYHEYTAEQVNAINMERTAEHQIIQTAAMMKQLRKSLTPPPLPPPPVPRKSSDTKAKAQKQQQQQQQQQQKQQREKQTTYDNSNSFKNANEQRSLFDDEDENKHRLLAIIHDDTNEVQQNRPPAAAASSSSSSAAYENNSRQTSAQTALPADEKEAQAQSSTAPLIQKQEQKSSTFEKTTNFAKNSISSKQSELIDTSSYQNKYSTRSSSAQQQSEAEKQISTEPFVQTNSSITNNKMQGIDSEFSKLFPSLGNTDIFDSAQKRFSNIETSNKEQFSAKLADKQTKRFSNIETSSYESKKRIENGHVVYDVSDSKRESFTDGDKPDSSILHFPVAERTEPSNAGHKSSTSTQQTSFGASTESCTNTSTAPTDVGGIMSALNLNTSTAGVPPPQTNAAAYTSSHSTANKETKEQFQKTINRQNSENSTFNKHISGTYEEFRQRAKAAAEAATKPLTAPLTSNGDNKPKSVFHFDHEKLFKDFDELSKQLNFELESGKAKKEQREKSASLFDLSRIQNESKTRFEEIKRQRHEHMQELEREIERSRRARQFMIPIQLENGTEQASRALNRTQSQSRTIKIPIHIENRNQHQNPVSAPIVKDSRTYEIPVQVDPGYREDRFRRAESMFDLSDSQAQPGNLYRQHTASSNQTESSHFDDWKRYASDLGSSENISRPFAREVEICYQRCKPHTIRAPRMTASTNDLTATNHSYDYHNAFNVRRTHAPMLNQVPQKTRPQYLSCHSMIERDPNPTYISTTSRRGVSPAPATMQSAETNAASVSHENEVRQQRRASLPREIHEQQLKYISSKEQELKTEFERLENERRRLLEEMNRAPTMPMPSPRAFRPSFKLPTLSEDEVFRQQMAEEWLSKVAEREERRLHKIIKISKISEEAGINATTMQPPCPKIDIGDEFLKRVKERRSKLAMPSDSDWESGAESHPVAQGQVSENEEVPPVKIIEGRSETDLRQLPKHMREFAKFSNHEREELDGGHREVHQEEERREESKDNSMSSAVKKSSIVKTYKVSRVPGGGPVTFATPRAEAAARKPSRTENASKEEELRHKRHQLKASIQLQQHQKQQHHPHHHQHHHHHNHYHQLLPIDSRDSQQHHKTIEQPALVVSATTANNKSINSTNTKLQQNLANAPAKRRKQTRFLLTPNRRSWSESDLLREIDNELQLAKGFLFADVYNVKHEYMSEPETENDRPRKMAQLARRQYDGIGPVTNDGMPIILRSEVKEPHQHEWYKRLYQTIHKQKNGDDYVIRYKCPRGRYQHKANGYVSEPEPNNESDYSTIKYRTLDRRRLQSTSSSTTNVRNASSTCQDDTIYGTMPNPIKSGQNSYKNQPGRIEDYVTGHSSVSEKEKKEWWDEVMDIFNGHLDQTKLSPLYTEGNLSRALAKESGYASDSNLVFHKKEVPLRNPLSPVEQKQAYKSVQSGGEPPLFGFRKPAPEKPKESPNRYFESDVNIHYKTPIRYEYKERIPEEELAIRQAEQMQKLYQEERRRKYLQELQDMNSRRHTDNFTPSQKSPIPLNRYDDFQSDLAPKSPNTVLLTKTIARALYNFQGQTARELTFRKGDVIYIRRQIDKNWYEGEHNAMIGLLPANYVEIISRDGARQPLRKPSEGQARAKYNFQAQSGIELSLNKGELVTLTRRVDKNWFEGKIANRKGIFPVCYVEVLSDIGTEDYSAPRAVMTSSGMRPSLDSLRTSINNEFNTITQNGHQPPNGILRETRNMQKTDVLHVDTSTSPIAYRALYKYRPQNSDELELLEGDLVHVLEKCDDGWFVGTSQRTGCFGTFPGNYVERA